MTPMVRSANPEEASSWYLGDSTPAPTMKNRPAAMKRSWPLTSVIFMRMIDAVASRYSMS